MLLNIVNVRQAGATMVIDINKELQKANRHHMAQLVTDLEEEYPNENFKGEVEIGLFTETIEEMVEELKADMVVMGTRGASGLKEVLIGSNAADAIKNVNSPLIVVPENNRLKAPEKVLLSSDFSKDSQEDEVDIVNMVRTLFNAEIEILHVKTEDEKGTEPHYAELMRKHQVDVHVITSEDTEFSILNYANNHQFDMITLVPKDRGIIRNLFHKSMTKQLSMHTDLPLFIWK